MDQNIHVHVPLEQFDLYGHFFVEHSINPEIYLSGAALDAIKDPPMEMDAVLRALSHGPQVTVHAPFMDLSPGAVDKDVRAVTMGRFHKTLDASELLGARAVVFHSGFEKWKYAQSPDIWLRESVRTWTELIKRAEKGGAPGEKGGYKIAIENIFEDEPTNLVLLMRELGSEHFGVCFDTGHYNLFTTVPLSDWLGPLKDHIMELHLHDNDTTHDAHLPIGEGTFDFGALFSELKGTGGIIHTIEAHTPESAIKGLEALRAYLSGS